MATKPAPAAEPDPEVVEPPRPMPSNVIEAIARVMSEIGGIEKLSAAQRRARGIPGGEDGGIQYSFRGIDQVSAAAQPLFGKYCVVIVPRLLSSTSTEIMVKDRPWTDMIGQVEWTIYGPGGVDDRIAAVTEGQAREMSDKAPPKVLTQAYKNLLLRLLCIGDPQDDTDGITVERDGRSGNGRDEPVEERPDPALVSATFERIKSLAADDGQKVRLDKLRRFAAARQLGLSEAKLATSVSYLDAIIALLDEPETQDEEPSDPPAPASEEPASPPQATSTGRGRKAKPDPPADEPVQPDPDATVAALAEAFPGSTLEEGEPGDR